MAEKTTGVVKAYFKLKAVTAAKEMASAHAVRRMRAKVSAGRPPSCHANTRGEQKKHGEKKPERAKEVPISPAKPLRIRNESTALSQ